MEECEDALNVWRPGSRLESRPGYVGVSRANPSGVALQTNFTALKEDNSGASPAYTADAAGVLNLDGLVKNRDRWYLGFTAVFNHAQIEVTTLNTANTIAKAEYYNGSEWKYLHYVQNDDGYHLASGPSVVRFIFADPQDWASVEVNSTDRYWIRFNVLCNDIANAVVGVASIVTVRGQPTNVRGMFAPQYATSKRYHIPTASGGWYRVTSSESIDGATRDGVFYQDERGSSEDSAPASIAVVPQFDECFVAYDHKVVSFRNILDSGDSSDTAVATVEDRDFAVGVAAPYDKRFVAMLGEFPTCNFIKFFAGRIWAAGLVGEPYTIRWSAAAPYHKVWTSLAFEYLMEDDNSPITGMEPLGEHMAVFKQDSIWLMLSVGENPATGVQSYVPKKVVSGVGCVAPSSIKQINGELIFLAESGVYAFNGTPAIRKITEKGVNGPDRLRDTIASIAKPKRPFAAAAHWKNEECYLLSFSTTGGANDTTIVWEYDKDRWWVWDNIEAQYWLEDEGVGNDEKLYFGDSSGRIYEFGVGHTDHGAAISSHVKTHRFGYFGEVASNMRSVRLVTANDVRSLSVEVFGDELSYGTATVTPTDISEKDWADFNYASGAATDDNWVEAKRRRARADTEARGEWHQVKVSHSTKYQPLRLSRVSVGRKPLGVR